MPTVDIQDIYSIIYQENRDPFSILGAHIENIDNKKVVVIRSYLPYTDSAWIVTDNQKEYKMEKLHDAGFFEVICSDHSEVFPYQIKVKRNDGSYTQFYDSYAFLPNITDFDLYLMQQGHHYQIYEKLGAHAIEINGISGIYFAVWAPNAQSVSIIGTFNQWNRNMHMMRTLGSSGVWELFIPGIGVGEKYKYQIKAKDHQIFDKTDPYGFFCEVSPQTASIVYDINHFQWNDQEWMKNRENTQSMNSPISIYEMHLGSWMRNPDKPNDFLSYTEIADRLVDYIQKMGYTHVEFLPVMEHPFYGSWGYQCLGLYAPSSRYGTPTQFQELIDRLHQNNIGVILDWVPAHFPKDGHGLAYFDGTYLYEHSDPRQREHKDWNTYIYNFGRYEVKNFLISNALFWLDKYHADGLRVDAVASMLYLDYSKKPGEWVPNEYGGRENLAAIAFLRECNEIIQQKYKGALVIAEESTAWPHVTGPTYLGGLGFQGKWNMGWMNDILRYMSTDPIYRKYKQNMLSFSIWYAFSEQFILPLSHDEVVYGKGSILNKMPGDTWQKFANVRVLYGFMFAHPGKKMLFMGADFGQSREWCHDRSLDWHLLNYPEHQKLYKYVQDLNHLYRSHGAFFEQDTNSNGFEWVDFYDADHSVIAFWRKGIKENLLFIFNFTPVVWWNYKLGLNVSGKFNEIFNSDAEIYGGGNVGNCGHAESVCSPWNDKPCTFTVNLPPLAMIVFSQSTDK